jgi:hypothetical protein
MSGCSPDFGEARGTTQLLQGVHRLNAYLVFGVLTFFATAFIGLQAYKKQKQTNEVTVVMNRAIIYGDVTMIASEISFRLKNIGGGVAVKGTCAQINGQLFKLKDEQLLFKLRKLGGLKKLTGKYLDQEDEPIVTVASLAGVENGTTSISKSHLQCLKRLINPISLIRKSKKHFDSCFEVLSCT